MLDNCIVLLSNTLFINTDLTGVLLVECIKAFWMVNMTEATSGAIGCDLFVCHAAGLQSQWTAAILKEMKIFVLKQPMDYPHERNNVVSEHSLPSSRTKNRVCIPICWLSPTSVSSSHRPGLDGYISRVAKLPVNKLLKILMKLITVQ